MTTYLHIANGAFGLLVDIDRVLEVSDIAVRDAAGTAGLRNWREQNLPVINLGAQLGLPGAFARQQVILRDDAAGDAAYALDVERVVELVDIDDRRLQPVNDISAGLTRLIDAAVPAAGGHCLLRLRIPFAWSDEGQGRPHGVTTP